MSLDFSEFIASRIDDITKNLRKTNAEYALASDKLTRLYKRIHPIITSTSEELTISHGDCMDFQQLLDEELTSAAIMQQALYEQGHLDCVKLLRMLGVLV
jgi:hypothetical protein